jgi:glycosyltransferase involved in cell wall biosynthesis
MIWPEILLNGYQKCVVHGNTSMILDPRHYESVNTVRIQRQASSSQLKFIDFLKTVQQASKFNLIYEIDDVLFYEDIPMYNKFRAAFTDEEVRKTAQQIMETCDEITVTCDYMKDYFASKTSNQNITVIPNYVPRFWMGELYDEQQKSINYTKSIKKRKRPRVLWSGSGAHFDQTGKSLDDDFGHIIQTVINTRKKYQWVLFGSFPWRLKQFIVNGDIEFHPWVPLYEYPRKLNSLKADVTIAPLQDNPFNNSKSDLKYIEGCALGTPVVCQDIATYKNTPFRFNTGDEMIDLIDDIISSKDRYMKICRSFRSKAEERWLESNIDVYDELYRYSYSDPRRKKISQINCT